jgi:hypothetical protein
MAPAKPARNITIRQAKKPLVRNRGKTGNRILPSSYGK